MTIMTFLLVVLLLIALALLNAMAFWQRHIFLYMIVAPADIVFGLYYAFQTDPFLQIASDRTPTFVVGCAIAALGIFFVYRSLMKLIGR
jgi:hypothetical protein